MATCHPEEPPGDEGSRRLKRVGPSQARSSLRDPSSRSLPFYEKANLCQVGVDDLTVRRRRGGCV